MPRKPPPPDEDTKRVIPQSRLRPKQERFVQHVAVHGNAKLAAKEAGYSPKTAAEMGYENLNKPHVVRALTIARKTAAEQAGISAVNSLKLALQHATYDPALLVDENGDPLALNELPPEIRAVIQGVDIVENQWGRSYRYRLVDKGMALEKIFRHLGLYEKDNAQAAGGISQLMQAIHGAGNRVPLKP